jgi:nucleoside-diphosphate-sugar epimerase
MSPLTKIIYSDAEKVLSNIDLSPLDGKSILITGASGIIGTHMVATLAAYSKKSQKHLTAYFVVQNTPSEHFRELAAFPGATIISGDITDDAFVKSLPSTDFVIHAAGYGQPGKFMENPIKTLKLNTVPAFILLEKLKPDGKFLFLSTSEVYSGLPTPPYHEDQIGTTNTDHPRACYIEAKRGGEAICNAYRMRGVDAKSARASLIYGPGTKPGDARVLNNFIFKALNGNINLLDQGLAKRTYCYATDAAEMLWDILLYGKDPIYNVGGTSKITIGDLARKIGSIVGAPVTFPENSAHAMAGAPDDVWLDLSKATKEFKKTNFVSLEEGLVRTIEWQRALYNK